jgi:hypothetical protein
VVIYILITTNNDNLIHNLEIITNISKGPNNKENYNVKKLEVCQEGKGREWLIVTILHLISSKNNIVLEMIMIEIYLLLYNTFHDFVL